MKTSRDTFRSTQTQERVAFNIHYRMLIQLTFNPAAGGELAAPAADWNDPLWLGNKRLQLAAALTRSLASWPPPSARLYLLTVFVRGRLILLNGTFTPAR